MIWKEEALQGHDVCFLNSENHLVLFWFFFFFSFPVFFCCSFYSSGCYLNVLKCSPESGPVKIRVGEILVYGTAIPVYSSYCCSAQKPQ